MMHIKSNATILIVEDSDDDYEATFRGLKRDSNLLNPIERCVDGQDTLDYLHKKGKYEGAEHSLPGIMLLDLNMPGIDGRTVLQDIKSTPYLKEIPVIVLTTSDDENDIQKCYEAGANTYIKKPVDLDSFYQAIKRLKEYWFEIAILPKTL